MKVLKYLAISFAVLLLVAVYGIMNFDSIPEPEVLPVYQPALTARAGELPGYAPGLLPDRVSLSLTADPARSVAVQWRTNTGVDKSLVQVALSQPGAIEPSTVTDWPATSKVLASSEYDAVFHQVEIQNLQPGTRYVYRAGDGNQWSEWFQFETAFSSVKPFSFLYFGDVQEGARQSWSRVFREAWRRHPESRFMLFVGDLVDDPDSDQEWNDFYKAMGWLSGMVPMVVTPGNHEYSGSERSPFWNAHFRFPSNGPEGRKALDNTVYSFDFQGVRFISINTNVMRGLGLKDTLAQRKWLEGLLVDNPNQWTVVFQHAATWSVAEGEKGSEHLQLLFASLFEKYEVDLVLQGDDHAYGRGQVGSQGENPGSPMYVISNSGTKHRAAGSDWAEVEGDNIQLYQHIKVDGNQLSYQAITASNQVFDQFTLVKSND